MSRGFNGGQGPQWGTMGFDGAERGRLKSIGVKKDSMVVEGGQRGLMESMEAD